MKIYLLEREQWIPRSPAETFNFFARAENLEQITPPWLHFRIRSQPPIEMRVDARIEYAIRLIGIPLSWTTRITAWEPEHSFVDVQESGPYALWEHTHLFTPRECGVVMIDRIRYALPLGYLGRALGAVAVRSARDFRGGLSVLCEKSPAHYRKIESMRVRYVCGPARAARNARASRESMIRICLAFALAAQLIACRGNHPPMDVVAQIDFDRYAGKWYEIASFPQHFQRGCVASTATYTVRDNGQIGVLNECRDGSFDGALRQAEGRAWVADPSGSNAKLKVEFFWPFRGDYWVIELDPNYEYAVVGHPSREYLWILSRTPSMKPERYARLLERVAAHGYALERLNETPQPTRH